MTNITGAILYTTVVYKLQGCLPVQDQDPSDLIPLCCKFMFLPFSDDISL